MTFPKKVARQEILYAEMEKRMTDQDGITGCPLQFPVMNDSRQQATGEVLPSLSCSFYG